MVSFQCDACQDVVKKPKLDQHRARGCGAGFTCIDCSTSFPTPVDWKGHTTCVSEAQKYQGSLYRGPKANGGGREHHAGFSSANGKFQGGRGGSWAARPPTRYQATGANGTPLGTPSRMSPVTTATPPIETPKAKASIPAESTGENNKANKKRKLNGDIGQAAEAPKPDDLSKSQNELNAGETKDTKEKKEKMGKKEKRDKHKKADTAISQPTVNGSSEPHDEALSSSYGVDPATGASEKKSKKSKKEKRKAVGEIPQAQEEPKRDVTVDSTINDDDIKEEKKEKKKKEKKNKHAEESPVAGESPMVVDAEPEEKKKSKKRKREAEEQVKNSKDATTGQTENAKKNKKKKKNLAPEI